MLDHYGYCLGEKHASFVVNRALYMLSDFIEYGMIFRQSSNLGQSFTPGYKELFESFLVHLKRRNMAEGSIKSWRSRLFKLEHFLVDSGVQKFSDVTLTVLNRYIETLAGYSTTTVSEIIRELRYLCDYALENGFHTETFSSAMPHVKNIRQQRLPSVFTPNETSRILASVDRSSPLGKRNYAMILLAARLGLRISDIRSLEFSSIDWAKKTIAIIQQKTGKPLELPLLDDVGWSIIDYLKHGRPESDSPKVFIRHSPPFDELSSSSNLVVQQMRKAGIESPANRRI